MRQTKYFMKFIEDMVVGIEDYSRGQLFRAATIPGVGVAGPTLNPLFAGVMQESESQNPCILLY